MGANGEGRGIGERERAASRSEWLRFEMANECYDCEWRMVSRAPAGKLRVPDYVLLLSAPGLRSVLKERSATECRLSLARPFSHFLLRSRFLSSPRSSVRRLPTFTSITLTAESHD